MASAKTPTPAQAYEIFRLADRVHVVGAMERGVTIYNQQVRAHNVVWAMRRKSPSVPERIAVVGGGIAGLTVVACLLSAFENAHVTLFERRWDLGPLQQGADHRWVHPHIYGWPADGSEQPSARIPLLAWKAGSASSVLGQVLEQFRNCINKFGPDRLTVRLGVEHLQIAKDRLTVEWTGRQAVHLDGFFRATEPMGARERFDDIVLTSGFGLETAPEAFPDTSYWRSEQRGQPVLDGSLRTYVVSGYGDGAIVDLCRLTIERFRQDRLLDEIFPRDGEQVRRHMLAISKKVKNDNLFELLEAERSGLVDQAQQQLQRRIRKDTKVFMHLGGKSGANTKLSEVFSDNSSFLNRFMLFLLYRCGAFVPTFGLLDDVVRATHVAPDNVVCRHGADTMTHLERLFVGGGKIRSRADIMKKQQAQTPELWFQPGFFRLP